MALRPAPGYPENPPLESGDVSLRERYPRALADLPQRWWRAAELAVPRLAAADADHAHAEALELDLQALPDDPATSLEETFFTPNAGRPGVDPTHSEVRPP